MDRIFVYTKCFTVSDRRNLNESNEPAKEKINRDLSESKINNHSNENHEDLYTSIRRTSNDTPRATPSSEYQSKKIPV